MGIGECTPWELFEFITRAWYGETYYLLNEDRTVYSRASHKTMSQDEALQEFLDEIGE